MGKPSQYVTSFPGQLSLTIPAWSGYSESWRVSKQAHRVALYPQHKLVSGWGLTKWRLATWRRKCFT